MTHKPAFRGALARNNFLSKEQLERMAEDPSPFVRSRVVLNPNTSDELFKHLFYTDTSPLVKDVFTYGSAVKRLQFLKVNSDEGSN